MPVTPALPRIAATALAFLAAAAPAHAATRLVRYSPVSADGSLRPGLRVTSTVGRSECWTTSAVSSRLYRCMTPQARIHDPCWATGDAAVVACPPAPWRRGVVELRLAKPLPELSGNYSALWALRTGGGRRCVFLQGASDTVAGKRVSYACGHDRYLLGSPDRSHATWTIAEARLRGARYTVLGTVHVRTAWRAVPAP